MKASLNLGDRCLAVAEGDLTRQEVDAIVNAANAELRGGGGVDGAIHRAGGPEIMAACRGIMAERGAPLETGDAVMTTAGHLPARKVIHTVGPIFDAHPDPDAALVRAYCTSFRLARDHGFASIAFPAISTGIYGFPPERAARLALGALHRELTTEPGSLVDVRVVLFGEAALRIWNAALMELDATLGL